LHVALQPGIDKDSRIDITITIEAKEEIRVNHLVPQIWGKLDFGPSNFKKFRFGT
jgi:hypothetical protein